ncbi:MAG: hypothetical protein KF797_05120 [Flavobacteriales bacterium]|nr:hypothetical protein [Flavobacteriales bacterium]
MVVRSPLVPTPMGKKRSEQAVSEALKGLIKVTLRQMEEVDLLHRRVEE